MNMNYGPQNVRPSTDPRNNPFDQNYRAARHAVSQPRTWPRKRSFWSRVKPYLSSNAAVIIAGIILAGILIVGIIIAINLTQGGSTAINVVGQPDSASQVAQKLGCTQFKDTGPAQAGGAVDTGNCKIGGIKYAIDTFASQTARDAWLTVAETMGVNPKWESPTSVTYKSVTGN